MRPLIGSRKRIPWKRMSAAGLRMIGQEIGERFRTNLTSSERQELRALMLRSRDRLRDLMTEDERRRLGQLVAKALTGNPR